MRWESIPETELEIKARQEIFQRQYGRMAYTDKRFELMRLYLAGFSTPY